MFLDLGLVSVTELSVLDSHSGLFAQCSRKRSRNQLAVPQHVAGLLIELECSQIYNNCVKV